MILEILGSGTSTGVPAIGCECRVCRSSNPRNKRLRASAWVKTCDLSILIDTSSDFRAQALRSRISRVDAVLYTHPHADHVHGIDDLRSYNFIQKKNIPIFGNAWTISDLKMKFPYIFSAGAVEGGGIPRLDPHILGDSPGEVDVLGVKVMTLPISHGSKTILGYRIGPLAYISDCSFIPESTLKCLENLDILVLDCVRMAPHRTHLNLESALNWASKIGARKTYLTHLSHEFDDRTQSKLLPKSVKFAYDGLKLKF